MVRLISIDPMQLNETHELSMKSCNSYMHVNT